MDSRVILLRKSLGLATGLFDGNAFRQIAGLVDIAAAPYSDMVCQQLQRNHLKQRQHEFAGDGNGDEMVSHFGGLFIAFAGDGNDNPAARLHFLDVRKGLFVMDLAFLGFRIARGEYHDRQIFIDERVRTMLHLAGGIAFGVDIRDFLEFERALESNGEMDAAPEIEKIGGFRKAARQFFVDAGIR